MYKNVQLQLQFSLVFLEVSVLSNKLNSFFIYRFISLLLANVATHLSLFKLIECTLNSLKISFSLRPKNSLSLQNLRRPQHAWQHIRHTQWRRWWWSLRWRRKRSWTMGWHKYAASQVRGCTTAHHKPATTSGTTHNGNNNNNNNHNKHVIHACLN